MSYTITTTMEESVYDFLVEQAKKQKTTKKAIIEEALKKYEKEKLKQEIIEWLKERQEENCEIADEFREAQCISLQKSEYGI